jgi:hypothetical protein
MWCPRYLRTGPTWVEHTGHEEYAPLGSALPEERANIVHGRGELRVVTVLVRIKAVLGGLIVPDGVRAVRLGVRRGVPPNLA